MQSLRRQATTHYHDPHPPLNTILQIDETITIDSLQLTARVKQLQSALNDLQKDYNLMQDAYLSARCQLEQILKQKQSLVASLLNLQSNSLNRDKYFKKIIEYVNAEMIADRREHRRRLAAMREDNKRIQRQLLSLKQSGSATTSDMDEEMKELNNLQHETKNSYLWDLEELFVKYLDEDNRLKKILFPVLRKIYDHPTKEDMLECCDKLFEELSLFEKDLKRTEKIGCLVEEFLCGTNVILYDDDDQESDA